MAFAFTLTVGVGSGALWLDHRDPLSSLPQPQQALEIHRTALAYQGRRRVEHMILSSAALSDIGIIVSLPDPLPDRKLPILIVLGGLGTGENNIRHLPEAGDNAIVGYDWPIPVRFEGLASLAQTFGLYGRVMAIPAQVTSAIQWLAAQSWADNQRISLLGFSLGTVASPAIEDVAEHDGQRIGWTILAYGGAPFGELVAASPHVKPSWLRPILASVVPPAAADRTFGALIRPIPDIGGKGRHVDPAVRARPPARGRAGSKDRHRLWRRSYGRRKQQDVPAAGNHCREHDVADRKGCGQSNMSF